MSNIYFRGARYQRGYGLGRCKYGSGRQHGMGLGGAWSNFLRWITPIFSKVKNFAMPIIKSSSKEVGKEVVSAASDIANSVLDGKNLKETAAQRIETGVDNLIDKASKKMEGKGINKRPRKIFGSYNKIKSNKKPRTLDIFDS